MLLVLVIMMFPINVFAQKTIYVERKYKDAAYEMMESKDYEGLNRWIYEVSEIYPKDPDLESLRNQLKVIEPFFNDLEFEYDAIENRTLIYYKGLKEINSSTNAYSEISLDHELISPNLFTYYGLIIPEWIFFRGVVLKLDDLDSYTPELRTSNKDEVVISGNELYEATLLGNEGNIFIEDEYKEVNEVPSTGIIRFKGQSDVDIELSADEISSMFALARYNEYFTELNRFVK